MKKILLILFMFLPISVFAFEPSSETLYKGIDVSYWQGNIDYDSVRNDNIEIAFIRTAVGTDYIDPKFRDNYNGFKNAGIKTGFYHYITARNTDEAIQEADFFASVISQTEPDCLLAMDFEYFYGLSSREVNEIAIAYLQRLSAKTGKKVCIYSDSYNAANIFSDALSSYPLWVAEYGADAPSPNGKWQTWTGFQYSDTGRISGISGNVDLDTFTDDILADDISSIVPSEPIPAKNIIDYVVKRGDTLYAIATRYNTTVRSIAGINDLKNPNIIFPGQILKIASTGNKFFSYIIKPGDTLYGLSKSYGITVAELAQINNIKNPNLIFAGEKLLIPN